MRVVGVIPARMESSRFPNKPMALIEGMPMIGHIYFRGKMCKAIDEVFVATCNSEIAEYIESLGGTAIMTSKTHERASERTAEAIRRVEDIIGDNVDIVVMIQGDEPMIVPEMLDALVAPFKKDEGLAVANLMGRIKNGDKKNDINEVKVVVDKNSFALYFSRSPIPYTRDNKNELEMFKQLGIIAFRRDLLLEFGDMSQTALEIHESVDMLRLLENGHKVKMILSEYDTYSVDTAEDLKMVITAMKGDKLLSVYKVMEDQRRAEKPDA